MPSPPRITHGVQAEITSARECVCRTIRRSASSGETNSASFVIPSMMLLGRQTLSNAASAKIETTDATTSTSVGPLKFETRYCGTANAAPATSRAGQISSIRVKPAKAQINQKGKIIEKKGNCLPIMMDNWFKSSPVAACNARMGVPNAPNATGAVLAINEKADAASGEKPSPIRIAPVTATGAPKPEVPSKKAPKQKATSKSCNRRSLVTPAMLSCKI